MLLLLDIVPHEGNDSRKVNIAQYMISIFDFPRGKNQFDQILKLVVTKEASH